MDSVHTARTRRGAPPSGERLSREDVVTAAVELLAGDGLDRFSVRRLAGALGVAPNALYNHVSSRDDLLDAVTDRLVATIRLPASSRAWPDWVRTVATRLRAQLLRTPGLTDLVLTRAGATAAGPRLLARFIDRLVEAGIDRDTAHLAWHTVLTVVVGSLSQHRGREADGQAVFEAVLDVLIAGLREAAAAGPSERAVALACAHRLTEG